MCIGANKLLLNWEVLLEEILSLLGDISGPEKCFSTSRRVADKMALIALINPMKQDWNLISTHIKYKPHMHTHIYNKCNQKYIHW